MLTRREVAIVAIVLGVAGSAGACGGAASSNVESTPPASGFPLAIYNELERADQSVRIEGGPRRPSVGEPVELRAIVPTSVDVPLAGMPTCPPSPIPGAACVGSASVPSTAKIPVSATVSWTVKSEAEYAAQSTGTYILETPANRLDASFLFKPEMVDEEEVATQRPERVRTILVTVALIADATKSQPPLTAVGTVDYTAVHEVPITTSNVSVPLVLAMFVNPNFDTPAGAGAYLLVRGDGNQPISCTDLSDRLVPLKTALDALGPLPVGTLTSSLTGVQRAVDAGRTGTNTKCRLAYSIPDLSLDPLHPGFIGLGNLSAEDSVSSLVMVGAPGAKAQFFNDRGWGPHENPSGDFEHNPTGGYFTLTVQPDQLTVTIRNLLPADPLPRDPVVEPQATAYVENEPPHRSGIFGIDSFNDELSAVFFPGPDRRLVLRR